MILYDLRCGIIERRKWLLLPILFFGIALGQTASYDNADATLGIYIFKLLKGDSPVDIENRIFNIPYMWLLIQLGCVLFTFEYPMRDMDLFGKQILVRCGSKIKWWLSKCIWCFMSVIIYWGVGLLMSMALCVMKNAKLTMRFPPYFVAWELDTKPGMYSGESAVKNIFFMLIMPFAACLALNYIQMLVSLLSNEIIAMSVSVFIIIWSMCIQTPIAFMNFTMMVRNNVFCADALDWHSGVVILSILTVASVLTGCRVIKSMDILEPKKNEA